MAAVPERNNNNDEATSEALDSRKKGTMATSTPRTVKTFIFGVGEVEFEFDERSPMSKNRLDYDPPVPAAFATNNFLDENQFPELDTLHKLRSPHPIIVRNNDARSLSWREFQLVEDAERNDDGLEYGLTPSEYYTLPVEKLRFFCSAKRILQYSLWGFCALLLAILVSGVPSLYAARHLLHADASSTPWAMIIEHTAYTTKVWAVGAAIALVSFAGIASLFGIRKWYRRMILRRAYERLGGSVFY